METDGSKVAVGAGLEQRFNDTGLEHPVGFFRWALSGSESNYAAYELEMDVCGRLGSRALPYVPVGTRISPADGPRGARKVAKTQSASNYQSRTVDTPAVEIHVPHPASARD